MIHSHYAIIARVKQPNVVGYRYMLRIPDFHLKYGVPDIMYEDIEVARKESLVVLYNFILLLSNNGNDLPNPMSPAAIHTHARNWMDFNKWDLRDYMGNHLIRLRNADMNWNSGPLPLLHPNRDLFKWDDTMMGIIADYQRLRHIP